LSSTVDSSKISHRFVDTNGIRMHIAEAGTGPLVVLCHGFPESWYSWRHQITALAEAGYHAVAPDQRGYGQTDRPEAIEKYTQLHTVGDIIGLLDALGERQAVLVGYDWGAPVAWNTAMMRPDRVRGVVGMSVPYTPRGPMSMIQAARQFIGDRFYMVYFQTPGVAEAAFEQDVRASLRRALIGASGDAPPGGAWNPVMSESGEAFDSKVDTVPLPVWLSEADLDYYTGEFERTGFRGGLNWYRTIDLSWELMAPYTGAKVTPPALFVAGKEDGVLGFPGMQDIIANLKENIPNLRGTVLLDGAGHWVQQERPAEVNGALLAFLKGL
jgi:pimeloyl-ACP methyl ester carboxylesterase